MSVLQKLASTQTCRVLIFKQMQPTGGASERDTSPPNKTSRNDAGVFLTTLYDSRNIVFVSSHGVCLYVSRDQLKPGGL